MSSTALTTGKSLEVHVSHILTGCHVRPDSQDMFAVHSGLKAILVSHVCPANTFLVWEPEGADTVAAAAFSERLAAEPVVLLLVLTQTLPLCLCSTEGVVCHVSPNVVYFPKWLRVCATILMRTLLSQ